MKIRLKRTTPAYHDRRTTRGIMRELLIGLLIIAAYSIYYQYTVNGALYGLKAAEIYGVAWAVALVTESIWALIHKEAFKDIFAKSFPLVTPLIYALTLPVGTPLYVVGVGAFIATFFGKLVYGGFGQNIFNPALVGRVIVHLSFGSSLTTTLGSVDATSSATPATMLASTGWLGGSKFTYTLTQLFLGQHGGTLGETCIWLIIIVGIILALRHVYDARITIAYLATVAILAEVTALVTMNQGVDPLTYPLIHLCLGGLMFGAVFMATDPVTSPSSPLGKIIYGICLGFLTMIIRLKANYPEGVLFSILIMNMLTPLIESFIMGRTNMNIKKQVMAISIALALCIVTIGGVATTLTSQTTAYDVVERRV